MGIKISAITSDSYIIIISDIGVNLWWGKLEARMNAKRVKTMPLHADRLRQARERMGFTQHELAERTQIGPATILRYEHGTADPSADYLARLAKTLNVSTDWLLGLTEEPSGGYPGRALTTKEEQWLLAYQSGDRDKATELFAERASILFRQAINQRLLSMPHVENGE